MRDRTLVVVHKATTVGTQANCSFRLLTDKPYPPDIQAAAKAGTLKPDDCTLQSGSTACSPKKPEGQKYGYGISQFSWGPNTIYFHGGEIPGFNSKISYDPTNQLTLIIWTNLTVSLDGQQTANTLFVKMLDHVYVVSPLR